MGDNKEKIERIRIWVYQQIDEINSYANANHRLILICSLIDAFAQNDSNYQKNNNTKHFTDFLEKYASKYKSIITEVCPITLFYNCFSDGEAELQLKSGQAFIAGDSNLLHEANRLINLLPKDKQEQKRKKHTYGALIYAMRNKLVHEMNNINSPFNFLEEDEDQLPNMVCDIIIENGKAEFKNWRLHIPSKFVFNVAMDAINGCLDYYESQGIDPFHNNNYERSCYYGWY